MISAHFVGRDTELAALAGHLEAAGRGHGVVVLLRGAAGIGKTRLVEEALAGRDGEVGRGYAVADRGAPPLWCWIQACAAAGLNDAIVALEDGPVRTDVGEERAAARFRWLTDVAETLTSIATPRVLVLEDLHWADRAALDLLRLVASNVAGTALAVVATTRPADAQREAQYGLLERFPTVATIDLAPLSIPSIAQLLDTTAEEAARVRADTHGLPLLLTAGTGDGGYDVRRIALSLTAQAGDRLRPDLEAAAVLGEQVDPALLAGVLGRAPDLDGLGRAGLLTGDGTRFLHALIRDAIAETVPKDRAAQVHRRAADHLMTVPDAAALPIATHLELAADPRVASWAAAAADEAIAGLAYDEAVGFLKVIEAAEIAAGADPAQVARTRLRIAEAAYLGGHPVDALAWCRGVATSTEDPDLLATAALVVREVSFQQADETNIDLARRALAVEQPAPIRSRLLAQLSTAYANSGRLNEATDVAAKAWRAAEGSSDPEALLAAAQAREASMNAPNDDQERLAIARVAAAHAEQLDRPVTWSLALGWQMRAAYALADLGNAAQSLDSLTSLTARTNLPLLQWRLARTVAAVASLEGRFEEADAANDEARRLALAAGDPVADLLSGALDLHFGALRGRFGDLRERNAFDEERGSLPIAVAKRALLRLASGDERGAEADYLRLRPLLWGPPGDLLAGAVFADLVRLIEHFADPEAAHAAISLLEPWLSIPGVVGIPMAYFCEPAAAYVGRCLLVADRPEDAIPQLRKAIDVAASIRSRPYAAAARCDLAEALLRTGAGREARIVLVEAAGEARTLDMPGVLERAEHMMPNDASDTLSPREREITDLVLAALSNRTIAERLVISERTVETHVRSVLGKLGCATRTELIARRAEWGL